MSNQPAGIIAEQGGWSRFTPWIVPPLVVPALLIIVWAAYAIFLTYP